ncbi:hypothetical protein F1D05_10815 [Kribbella qitaiheensis]|uniref:Uncharacterized protein n=1 Tax=Kribbella qitaiheensis TaxID=1544730 RepID=A0A7G6WWC9_9ACTN|nr:hypothetical protein [Kribbella qitaiheensis]QNE18294.1 hypothetical protein F1D05_10815 [Kribbella qitaiheensis]
MTPATVDGSRQRRRKVRVWFGSHLIASYCAEPALATRYAASMDRRFAGLRVTNEPLPLPDDAVPASPAPDLPSDQLLWPLTAL